MSGKRVLLAVLILAAGACAPATSPSPGVSGAQRNFITEEEILASGSANAFDAVRVLRPTWLVMRGPQSVSTEPDIIVYLGSARLGGLQALRETTAGNVTSMEYLNPAAANFRFGAGHPYGAIIVSTR